MARVDIQNAIRNVLENLEYDRVRYTVKEGIAELTGEQVKPSTIYVNETSSTFSKAKAASMGYGQVKSSWTFKAKLQFTVEVDISGAERALEGIPRKTVDSRNYSLRVVSIDMQHPPRKNPSGGSVITFVIQVEPISGR